MTVTINAQATNGLITTADGSGILKVQSNGVATNSLVWCNFIGSTAVARASYNISSITRNSTGQFIISMTNSLSNANYVPVGCSSDTGTSDQAVNFGSSSYAPSYTTSSFRMVTSNYVSTLNDKLYNFLVVFGN